MKIAFLILASNTVVNENDRLMQAKTWAKSDNENIVIVWVRGSTGSDFNLIANELYVPTNEGYDQILEKTVLAAKWLKTKYNPDFVIRTNVSTYFDLEKCQSFLHSIFNKNYDFFGYPEVTKFKNELFTDSYRFISGAGIFLSREGINHLSKLDSSIYRGIPDDVAISHYFDSLGIQPRYITRCNLGYTRIFFPNWYLRLKSSEKAQLTQSRFISVHRYYLNPSIPNFLRVQLQELSSLEGKALTRVVFSIYVSAKRWLQIRFQGFLK